MDSCLGKISGNDDIVQKYGIRTDAGDKSGITEVALITGKAIRLMETINEEQSTHGHFINKRRKEFVAN